MDALAIVVGHVGPPVRLGLDVPQDHVLDRYRHAEHLGVRLRLACGGGIEFGAQQGTGPVTGRGRTQSGATRP